MPRVGKPDLKDKLLAAALRCFARKGYYASTVDEIAAEAHVTKGAVYWHYKDKAELFLAVVRDRVDLLVDEVYSEVDLGADPADQLRSFMLTAFDFYADNPEFTQLVSIMRSGQYSGLEQYLTEQLREYYRRARSLLGGLIRFGIEHGTFVKDDPELVAAAVLAVLDGMALQSVVDPETIDLRAIAPIVTERTLFSLLVDPTRSSR